MRTQWTRLIGRHSYRVDVGDSGRWMLVRERADEEDDEVVCRGRQMTSTIDEILAAIVDELQCLAEEIQSNDDTRIDSAAED